MEEFGIGSDATVLATLDTPEAGRDAFASLLDGPDRPTAVLVGSESLLDGLLAEADARQIALGRDLSVVDEDVVDAHLASLVNVGDIVLTSDEPDIRQLLAARALVDVRLVVV